MFKTNIKRSGGWLLLTAIAAAFILLQGATSASAVGVTFTVNTKDDVDNGSCTTNHCSLREAINAANANAGTDTIAFAIPASFADSSGRFTISVGAVLPWVSDAAIIDGSTQTGASCGSSNLRNILVQIRPAGPLAGNGLGLANGSIVRGLSIGGFGWPTTVGWGTGLNLGSGNTVECSNIGIDASGTTATPNQRGITVFGADNTIGGNSPDKRNIISGNYGEAGIVFWDIAATGNRVRGNYIGTNASGDASVPNGNGVGINHGASNNVVGDGTAAGRNVISGNNWAGVIISSAGANAGTLTTGNQVLGNYIGTDAAGALPIPNGQGVQIQGATGNTIGSGNVISGNRYQGISLIPDPAPWPDPYITSTSFPHGNWIQDNLVGVAANGVGALPNHWGIMIQEGNNNQILRNTIAHNDAGTDFGWGIVVSPRWDNTVQLTPSPVGNRISQNSIFDNGPNNTTGSGQGINANVPRNPPNLSSAVLSGGTVAVTGNVSGPANSAITIELFRNTACDPSGRGEGQTYLTTLTASIPAGNTGTLFSATLGGLGEGTVLTATATAADGTTSVFSNCFTVVVPQLAPTYTVNSTLDDDDGACQALNTAVPTADCTLREAINAANNHSNSLNIGQAPDRIEFNFGAQLPPFVITTSTPGLTGQGAPGPALPPLYEAVVLDALPNTSSSCGPTRQLNVQIVAPSSQATGQGLVLFSNGSTIRGIAIGGFGANGNGAGLYIAGSNNFVECGNFGTDGSGMTAQANATGVYINGGSNNTIGGSSASQRNIISGNRDATTNGTGIFILGATATGNRILGNYIGTNSSGSAALPNGGGVSIRAGQGNFVGGSAAGERNVISGNGQSGVLLVSNVPNSPALPSHASGNKVLGNYIGVSVDGMSAIPNAWAGINISGGLNNLIGGSAPGEGNVISGNGQAGIGLYSIVPALPTLPVHATGNQIKGNYIGVGTDGATARPNANQGIIIQGGVDNVIGGSSALARNIISGNGGSGMLMAPHLGGSGEGATGNIVVGNYIGTNVTGTAAVPNGSAGVYVRSGSHHNVIGRAADGERNVISGNLQAGIRIEGATTTGNRAVGNFIGTNAAGTLALGNAAGIQVHGSSGNTIGGLAQGEGNLIGGSINGPGITLSLYRFPSPTGITFEGYPNNNRIEGNHIGVGLDGATPLPNLGGITINAGNNNPVTRNTVAYNSGNGVEVILNLFAGDGTGTPTVIGNALSQNAIYNNGGLGILTNGAPQAAPTIGGGAPASMDLSVPVAAGTTVVFELFSNGACDPSGAGEGKNWAFSTVPVTADSDGFARKTVHWVGGPIPVPPPFMTATATRADGTTSAFSNCVALNPTPNITSVTPNSVVAGAGVIPISVSGSGFVASSEIFVDGVAQVTTLASSGQLTASIPVSAGTLQLTVVTPGPGGGISNVFPIFVTAALAPIETLDVETVVAPAVATVEASTSAGQSIQAVTGEGTGTVAVANYETSPGETPTTFQAGNGYFDVYVAPTTEPTPTAFTSVTITYCDPGGADVLYWSPDGSSWLQVPGVTVTSATAPATGTCLTFTVTDDPLTHPNISDLGGTAFATARNRPPVAGEVSWPLAPLALGSTAAISLPVADPDTADLHSLAIDWGDGPVGQSTPATGTTLTAAHVYAQPGVYGVSVTVSDGHGGVSAPSRFQYIVVYDPEGGFVTGGGWIQSPQGACAAVAICGTATGKATFGFESRYKKGATIPTGNTEFQFKAGNLTFKSSSYEWLVIAGAKAQYKGEGTINGQGSYRFMLTAIDGAVNGGGGVDKFRIRIWSDSGGLVYDNQLNAPDDADPTTAIGGGSIVIHKER